MKYGRKIINVIELIIMNNAENILLYTLVVSMVYLYEKSYNIIRKNSP